MDKISGIGKSSPLRQAEQMPSRIAPRREMEDPGDMVLEYVCSKGDVEHHSIKDSFAGVRAHEEHHISEYHEIANKLGLQVVNPHISVFSEFFPEFGRQVATGGRATCQFAAIIDGQQVLVPVSKDGHITDSGVVKKLEMEKKRRMGLLPKKDEKKSESPKTADNQKDEKIKSPEKKDEDKKKKEIEEDRFLFFDGNS